MRKFRKNDKVNLTLRYAYDTQELLDKSDERGIDEFRNV